ncbi:MAG: hypothetical protein FWE53_02880 [Firmicutes bacterium]|nr:hypothetical protein [Bacillota bacterium]
MAIVSLKQAFENLSKKNKEQLPPPSLTDLKVLEGRPAPEKELGAIFGQIDSKFGSGLFDTRGVPELERLQISDINKNDITALGQESLEEYKQTSLARIEADAAKQQQRLDDREIKAIQTAEAKEAAAAAGYGSNVSTIKDNMLSRGLARSSILENSLNKNEFNKLRELDSIRQNLIQETDNIRQSAAVLESQKEAALAAFDIAYAAKLQDKIGKLTTDAEKKNQDIIKYNNTIARQEETMLRNQQQDLMKRMSDYAKIQSSSTADYFADAARQEKMQAAYDYLNSFGKQDALSFALTSQDLRRELGRHFETLISRLNLRES